MTINLIVKTILFLVILLYGYGVHSYRTNEDLSNSHIYMDTSKDLPLIEDYIVEGSNE